MGGWSSPHAKASCISDFGMESPLCKSQSGHSAAPVMPEVSSGMRLRVQLSTLVSFETLYSGRAPSDTLGTDTLPSIHTLLYGGRPPLAPVSMWMSRFADKDFTPFKTQSATGY